MLSSVGGQPVYRGLYEQSLRTFATRVREATIPVERIEGRVLLTAGGNGLVWPSDWFATQVCARRAMHGLSTEVVTSTSAGHWVPLPGEPASPARAGGWHGAAQPRLMPRWACASGQHF
ncbi:MAG: acyl-CoA thioester hydrolase/BAAT C-terminal domain-containing protein [Pseudonocardiaceae bacterium]